ncbi:MAG: TonB family protein [Bacteroidetes bacterium]|nr:MAG: TonB family protein [Bacteroidota bacterium]
MGKVVVQFTVEKDGALSDVSITESVHPLLDNEALEVLKYMPRWIPAKVEGRPVKAVKYSLPMKFTLR